MKIKNISNQTLNIPFKTQEGKGIIVSINPGQIVFCEDHTKGNKQVVIFLRKNKIEVSEDNKPTNAQYYHAYGVLSHDEVLKLKQSTANTLHLDNDDDDDESESSPVNESVPSDLEIKDDDEDEDNLDTKIESDDDEDDEDGNLEEKDNESVQVKNKGGRPKGSKNKKKSKKPKKKKPIGRPKKNKKTDSE